jgi:hypothetical protein
VYRVRYGTKTSSSTQKKGERKIRVLEGPHTDDGYKHGPVVCVRDLTDPRGPTEKVFYVDRFVSVELIQPTSDRHQRRDDRAAEEEQAPDDGLAEGDLVSIDRRETDGGDTAGSIVNLDATHASVKPAEGRSFKVKRSLLNKTSLASINRKTARMKFGRRRRGVGTIL